MLTFSRNVGGCIFGSWSGVVTVITGPFLYAQAERWSCGYWKLKIKFNNQSTSKLKQRFHFLCFKKMILVCKWVVGGNWTTSSDTFNFNAIVVGVDAMLARILRSESHVIQALGHFLDVVRDWTSAVHDVQFGLTPTSGRGIAHEREWLTGNRSRYVRQLRRVTRAKKTN